MPRRRRTIWRRRKRRQRGGNKPLKYYFIPKNVYKTLNSPKYAEKMFISGYVDDKSY